MADDLFTHIFGREPKVDPDDAEARQHRALEKALHMTTEDNPGTPMQYDNQKTREKAVDEPEWW